MGHPDGVTTRSSQLRAGRDPIPATRPRGTLAFVLPLLVAAAAGLALGLSPHAALAVEAAVLSALVLVLRLDWAALAVIATAAFQDYLDLISPWATQWLAGVLVLAWLVRRAQGPLHGPLPGSQHGHRLRVPALLVALLLGAVLIAYLAHPLGRPGLTVCATYAEFAIVMLILADTLGGPLAPHRAARVFVVSCVLASCCGLVTAIGSGRHQVAGPVASPDTLAFFLIAAVPLVGTVRSRESQPVWWVWACFVILLGAGIGTQSRPAFVALVAMVVVAVATGLLALRYAGALLAVVLTAVALLVASEEAASRHGWQSLGKLTHYAYTGCDPRRMGLGPVRALDAVLHHSGMRLEQADVIEINEAFAVQVLAVLKCLKEPVCARRAGLDAPLGEIADEQLNPRGGAIALGHPVGATGARLVLSALDQLRESGGKRALVSLCIGGGQGGAALLERD